VDVVGSVPHHEVALVLGAGVDADGRPSNALRSRIDAAAELYRAGAVRHLLVSGDNSSVDYDEVTVMRDELVARGVPLAAITRDHAGFDTYDSCVRAKEIFGVRDAVVVTQDFHIDRAVYTCRQVGVEADGLRVPDWRHRPDTLDYAYPRGMQLALTLREWASRTNAVWETGVTRPAPQLLGPHEGLGEH
jgi:vancomycin permeability regulator SanA